MGILLVVCDFRRSSHDYSKITEQIKSYPQLWRYTDLVWLIRTEESPNVICAHISELMEDGDKLLVIDVLSGTAAWHGFEQQDSDELKNILRLVPHANA